MIVQPSTSRVSADAWARMTEEQQMGCVESVRNRELLTKAAKDPNALTERDVKELGVDIELVVDCIEDEQTRIGTEMQSRSTGVFRQRGRKVEDDDFVAI